MNEAAAVDRGRDTKRRDAYRPIQVLKDTVEIIEALKGDAETWDQLLWRFIIAPARTGVPPSYERPQKRGWLHSRAGGTDDERD